MFKGLLQYQLIAHQTFLRNEKNISFFSATNEGFLRNAFRIYYPTVP